ADAEIISAMLNNCDITFPQEAVFFGNVNCGDIIRKIIWERIAPLGKDIYDEEMRNAASKAYSGGPDIGHTAPVWDDIMKLGLRGLLSRVLKLNFANPDSEFVASQVKVYEAAIGFVKRAADTADRCGKSEIAEGLRYLADNPPSTLYQAMQMTFVFYTLQHFAEGTNLRTLGRLDRLFMPFYKPENAEAIDILLDKFMIELNAIRAAANIPFMLCGSDADGNDLTNEMSYAILRSYIRLKPSEVKFHILTTEKTPEDFLRLALEGIKSGANSLVFMNDAQVIRSLEKLGETHEAAADYSVIGCYESGGREETTCSCNGIVNIPKALELALHKGIDVLTGKAVGDTSEFPLDTFDGLYSCFIAQLDYMVKKSMEITNGYEKLYSKIHSAPFFTSTYKTCVANGGDVYCNNSTPYANSSINAIGLATAVDSLAAVRKRVYEDGKMSLAEFVAILDADWEGNEVLRGIIKRKYPKYGNGDKTVDSLAADIVSALSDRINNIPNAKGGVYRLGLFSIDWRIDYGKRTAASADGRKCGETLSQNTGASFGCDREGTTAHLLSVTEIDCVNVPNGAIVDIDLHMSAVRGENGTTVMLAALKTYIQRGGIAVHYNVLDTASLRDAKEHPEKYPNLQVRLCGWNVKFTELSPAAQDEFIRRSEHQAG
nr:hypothetical protein [Clostridia bacterium]